MKIILTVLILFLLFVSSVYCQATNEFPKICLGDLHGSKIEREIMFDGNALWGYIDGGADIYLEYGFDKMLLQEIAWKGNTFKLEYYRMKDAGGAYGIFSVSKFNCNQSDTLIKFICITQYQVQAAIGRYYISISNDNGKRDAQDFSITLLSSILKKCTEKEFIIPEFFRNKNFTMYLNKVKYIRGKLGLQNGFPEWIDLFEEFNNYELFILPMQKESGFENISLIKFKEKDDLPKFVSTVEKMKSRTKTYKTEQINSNELIFVESDGVK